MSGRGNDNGRSRRQPGQPNQSSRRQQSGRPQQGAPQGQGQTQTQESENLDILMPGEEVITDTRPAWTAWFKQLLLAVLLMLGGVVFEELRILLLAGVIVIGYVIYQRLKVRYVVTNERVVVKTGLSSSATNEAWIDEIRSIQTGASFVERILGHGHITVSDSILPRGSLLPASALSPNRGLTLGGIRDHDRVASRLRNLRSTRNR